MKNLFKVLGHLLLTLLFPTECINCQREGAWLCAKCFNKLLSNNANKDNKKDKLIITHLNEIFIAGDYDNQLLAELIKKFKYNFFTALGDVLGDFLIMFWEKQLIERGELLTPLASTSTFSPLLIPMPLTKKREHWRGFNQAKILAQKLEAHFSYEISYGLQRLAGAKPQATLKEAERLHNIKNVFAWQGESLKGQTIILIDDVVTTGATLNEAARILRQAGAIKIYGLVLAKG